MEESGKRYYNALLPVPKGGIYTYSSDGSHRTGERVIVPLRRREITGIITEECKKPEFQCRDILMSYDEEPLFTPEWLEFIKKLAEYYCVPIGLALHGVISDKLLNLENARAFDKKIVPKKEIELTDVQKEIAAKIETGRFSRHLIYGITGSGKTEVYLEAAKRVIAEGGQALYIVPEISLTPQLTERIAGRFGYMPPVFHSKMDLKSRETAFLSFAKGETDFLIGARSALFVPAKNPGIIIVDEEHEPGFKQEEAPPYHLRDMAVLYASILNIPVVMGSATPSAESVYNVRAGKYLLHKMPERPKNAALPDIEIIDVKNCDMIEGVISEPLYDRLSETVRKGEQAILFLNRKGYSTSIFCKKCGEPVMCANCSVGLVYFKSKNVCSCRYCGTDYRRLSCAACGGNELTEWGAGTEKVAEFMESMFPGKVLRIDMENASTVNRLSSALKAFEKKEAQILVGTQLVAKGLHFPSVTLVGVLGIDNMLAMPDFRASERAYQLLVQVSGRAGREELKGRVYIQTAAPDNPVLRFVETGDQEAFYKYELARREAAGFPPYIKMARLLITHRDAAKCREAAKAIAKAIKDEAGGVSVLGPADADIFKVKNRHRVSILLKSVTNGALKRAIETADAAFEKLKCGSMLLKIDKDPYFMN